MNHNNLRDKAFAFAVRIVKLARFLADEKKEFIISKQIIRSGTSIGANLAEAQGVSKGEFVQRISLGYREAQETKFWLKLLKETDYIDEKIFQSLFEDNEELSKILFKSLKTSKE